MAVSILTNKIVGNGNGVARTFSFSPVIIGKSSDIVVVKRDIAGLETSLSEGSSATTYSVSVSSFPGTGSIDYPAVGGTLLQTGESISMKSVRDLTQSTDLENQGGYFADTQETAFDKLTYISQQQQEEINRSLKIPVTDTTTTLVTLQANLLVVAGIQANIAIVAGISANVTTVAGISANVTTVAGIASDVSSVASQSFKYLFDASTAMADPGSGDVRYNNATPASVTQIAISNTFSGGADISEFINTWDDVVNAVARAYLVFRKGGSGTVFQVFKVTGVITDNTSWLQIPVTHVAGATLPAASDDLYIGSSLSGASGSDVTTKGDLQTFSTVPFRLPVGNPRQKLLPDTAEASGLKWVNQAETLAKSGTYTVLVADQGKMLALSGASFTVTLPVAATAGDGFLIGFKHEGTSGSQQYTIDGDSAEQIDGAANQILSVTDETIWLIARGSNWQIKSQTYKSGAIIQQVNIQDGELANSGTTIPIDNTIPEITEGGEFMTLAITPTNTSNLLKIDVVVNMASDNASVSRIAALFQDAVTNALAAAAGFTPTGNQLTNVKFTHYMTAGTISSTTFRVRCGANAGQIRFNGNSTSRLLGGVLASSITITEIKA